MTLRHAPDEPDAGSELHRVAFAAVRGAGQRGAMQRRKQAVPDRSHSWRPPARVTVRWSAIATGCSGSSATRVAGIGRRAGKASTVRRTASVVGRPAAAMVTPAGGEHRILLQQQRRLGRQHVECPVCNCQSGKLRGRENDLIAGDRRRHHRRRDRRSHAVRRRAVGSNGIGRRRHGRERARRKRILVGQQVLNLHRLEAARRRWRVDAAGHAEQTAVDAHFAQSGTVRRRTPVAARSPHRAGRALQHRREIPRRVIRIAFGLEFDRQRRRSVLAGSSDRCRLWCR